MSTTYEGSFDEGDTAITPVVDQQALALTQDVFRLLPEFDKAVVNKFSSASVMIFDVQTSTNAPTLLASSHDLLNYRAANETDIFNLLTSQLRDNVVNYKPNVDLEENRFVINDRKHGLTYRIHPFVTPIEDKVVFFFERIDGLEHSTLLDCFENFFHEVLLNSEDDSSIELRYADYLLRFNLRNKLSEEVDIINVDKLPDFLIMQKRPLLKDSSLYINISPNSYAIFKNIPDNRSRKVLEVIDTINAIYLTARNNEEELAMVEDNVLKALSNWKHQLLNPITVLMSNAEASSRIADRYLGELLRLRATGVYTVDVNEVIGRLEKISEITARPLNIVKEIKKLTDQLNLFLQLQFGSYEPIIEPVSIPDAISDLTELHRNDENVRIILDIDEAVKQWPTDKSLFKHVIDNFLSNGIKYNQSKDKILYVTGTIDHESGKLIIAVIDNGIGISSEEQLLIFNQGFRGANANNVAKGSGLGLGIVASAIKKLQANHKVESNIGYGSTFTIELPYIHIEA